jgi:hypothetical protein
LEGCRDISCCPTGNIPTMFYLSGHFPLTNRKCSDTQKVSEHFLLGCRDISCCPIGNIPTRKSVGTFPIGVVGTFLVGCVGTSTGSVSGHFYRPITTPLICLGVITVLISGIITTPLICLGIITVFHFRDYYCPPISGIIPPPPPSTNFFQNVIFTS